MNNNNNFDFDAMTPVQGGGERITTYWPGPADDRTIGMTVAGTYVEPFTFNKGQEDESTVYKLRGQDGETIYGVNGSASIVNAFSSIEPGQFVAIRFNGKKKNPKTGRTYNDFEVRTMNNATTKAAAPVQGEPVDLNGEDPFSDIPFGV